jgi:hypothetical protein
LTVSRDAAQGTGVASVIHISSNQDGQLAATVTMAWHNNT